MRSATSHHRGADRLVRADRVSLPNAGGTDRRTDPQISRRAFEETPEGWRMNHRSAGLPTVRDVDQRLGFARGARPTI